MDPTLDVVDDFTRKFWVNPYQGRNPMLRPIGESAVRYAKERSEREPHLEIRVWEWPIPGHPSPLAKGYAVRASTPTDIPGDGKDFPGGVVIRRFKAGQEL